MKKAVSLILALVLCLGLCACTAEPKETEPAGVELTLDNYDDYLEINVEDDYHQIEGNRRGLSFIADVTGVSSNYNYDNVTVKVRIHGSYQYVNLVGAVHYWTNEYNLTIEIDTNIAGNGQKESTQCRAPSGCGIAGYADFQYEIIEVSGTVSPV